MSFRWFGPGDPVSLPRIRQIPGVEGVVSALYDVPAGEVWPRDELNRLGERIEGAGLRFAVVESIPVHDDIKLGLPSRDRLIERYCESVRNVGEIGVGVLCYNFMPVLDWTRTSTDMQPCRRLDHARVRPGGRGRSRPRPGPGGASGLVSARA